MRFISYAQNFEDVLLLRALHDVKEGRYIDIGAQDPIVDSVSMAFYQAGWRGVHVEPTQYFADRLRCERPDETIIQAAVTDRPGPITLYEIPNTGLSTGRTDIADRHKEAGCPSHPVIVSTIRLDQLLAIHEGDLHWLKIDVEGMEADVLASWGDSDVRPWVLVIDATFPGTRKDTDQLWVHHVVRRGYREVCFDGVSRYFVHDSHAELAAKFAVPPNIFDDFSILPNHFAASEINQICDDRLAVALAEGAHRESELRRCLEEARERAEASAAETLLAAHERDEALGEVVKFKVEVHSAARDHQIVLHSLTVERDRTAALEQMVATDRKHHAALEILLNRRQAAEADALKRLRKSETEREVLRAREARLTTELAALGVERDNMASQVSELRGEATLADRHREDALAEAVLLTERSEVLRREGEVARAFAEQSWLAAQRATAIIGSVFGERSGFWQSVEELLGVRRSSRIRDKLESASQVLTEQRLAEFATHRTSEEHGAPRLSGALMSGRNPCIRAESLAELLSWQDVDFVRCAYVTLLGRQPDPDGEATYLVRLRDGYSKLTIAAQLRFSSEGRRHDPGILGLDRQLRRHRNATRLLTGWFLRAVTAREGDTRSERESRRLQAQIRRSEENQIHAALGYADAIRELRHTLSAMSRNFEMKSDATSEHIQNLAQLISPIHNATENIQSAQSHIEGRLDSVSAILRDIESELVETKQLCTIEDILQTFGTDVDA